MGNEHHTARRGRGGMRTEEVSTKHCAYVIHQRNTCVLRHAPPTVRALASLS